MAVSGCLHLQITSASSSAFECRSDPDFRSSPRPEKASYGRFSCRPDSAKRTMLSSGGLSSLIFRFPPNFVRQLSTKARRNCSNIGVAQVVAASWSNNNSSSPSASAAPGGGAPSPAAAIAGAAAAPVVPALDFVAGGEALAVDGLENGDLLSEDLGTHEASSFFTSDGSLTVHAGMDPLLVSGD